MIPYKQLSLADIFSDYQDKFENDKPMLRHTHGTTLSENSENPKTVIERLEHKNIKTILQTYTFHTEVMQQTAVDVFEKTMNG